LLLLHEVQHLERIGAAEVASPDHTELPRALSAKVSPLPLPYLLLVDLHTRGPYPTILTYHLLNDLLKHKTCSCPSFPNPEEANQPNLSPIR
jgi:hypothetical protein